MPDFIGDDLRVRVLHDKADFAALVPERYLLQLYTIEEHFSAANPMRCKDTFQMPQQRGFAAAVGSAENHIFPFFDGQADIRQHLLFPAGIGKT